MFDDRLADVDPRPVSAAIDQPLDRAPLPPRLKLTRETLAELHRAVKRLSDFDFQYLSRSALDSDIVTTVEEIGVAPLLADPSRATEPRIDV
jgi:hypothetical protein